MRLTHRTTAAVPAALLVLGLLAGCSDDDGGGGATDAESGASDTASATTSATADATEDAPTSSAPDPSVVPSYFVGKTPAGDRLYREFVQVDGVDPLAGAAAAVTSGGPIDPDYRTLWPHGRFDSVTRERDAIVVELPDAAWLEAGTLKPAEARLAVQQLVYTLQGVAGKRLPIRVVYDDKPAATLLGVDVGQGLRARPQLDVLALVNVTEPAEGSTVGSSLEAEGRASSFEATVPWEIRDASGEVVLDGSAMADGWVDKLHPWTATIDTSSLDPGSYTFVARTDDPSDGEGFGPTEDTKRITIE